MPLLFIDNWFNNAFIQALGWTLFHSLWQGFLLVVLVSLAIVVTRRSSATIRYRIFSSLFFLFIGATLCTFIIEFSSLRSIPTPSLLTGNEIGDTLTLSSNTHTAAVDLKVPLPGRLAFYFNEYGPWLMLLWFIVFMLKSIRLGINYAQVQRIRNEKPYLLPAIEKRVNELAKLLHIRRKVILRETTSITVPVTIGFLKPLILIPCGLINNLPPDQVEAILLHELAHIKRADYLVNLLQCMAETVFFFNPAVIWLSSLLREERENCCDDIAITVTQNKSLFIHALVAFQEYHAGHPMAPGLQGNKYPLLKRIQRIVYNNNKKLNHMEKIFLAAGLVVTGIVALAFTTPSTHKKPDTDISTVQKFKPAYSVFGDTVPEAKKNEEAKKLMDLYQGQTREAQKRSEESVLLEKLFKDQESTKLLIDMDTKADLEKKMTLFQDDQKGNELFNQEKKMEFQERFLKELQDDKVLTDLQKDNFLKDIRSDKEMKLFRDGKDNAAKHLLLDKLKKGGDERKVAQEYMQLLEKQIKTNDKNMSEGERQLFLQKGEIEFQKMLQLYQDTAKPRKVDEKNKLSKEEAEARQEDMEKRRIETDTEREARLKEMAQYRAMLQKEREKDREKLQKERAKDRAELEEKKKKMDRELEKDRKEIDKDRKEWEEKKKEMQKEREKDRKQMEKEKGEKMKEIQKEREKDREEMEEKRKEMQREREKQKRLMDEERRREEKDQRDKEEKEQNKEDKNKDDKVYKVDSKFNYNDNKSFNYNSKEETTTVNKNGQQSMDYKWEAKGYKPRTDERVAAKRAEMNERRKADVERRDQMLKELKEDGILPKDATGFSIHIDDNEMVVNGVKQPENVFNKYRNKIGKKLTKPSPPNPAAPVIKATPTNYKAPTIKMNPDIKLNPGFKPQPIFKKPLVGKQFTFAHPQAEPTKSA